MAITGAKPVNCGRQVYDRPVGLFFTGELVMAQKISEPPQNNPHKSSESVSEAEKFIPLGAFKSASERVEKKIEVALNDTLKDEGVEITNIRISPGHISVDYYYRSPEKQQGNDNAHEIADALAKEIEQSGKTEDSRQKLTSFEKIISALKETGFTVSDIHKETRKEAGIFIKTGNDYGSSYPGEEETDNIKIVCRQEQKPQYSLISFISLPDPVTV
jgi:hypothetical protein